MKNSQCAKAMTVAIVAFAPMLVLTCGGCPQRVFENALSDDQSRASADEVAPVEGGSQGDDVLATLAEELRALPEVILPDPPPPEFVTPPPPDIAGASNPLSSVTGAGGGSASTNSTGDGGGGDASISDDSGREDGGAGDDGDGDDSASEDDDGANGDDDGAGGGTPPPTSPFLLGDYSGTIPGQRRQIVDEITGDPNLVSELNLDLPAGGDWQDMEFAVGITIDEQHLLSRAFFPGFLSSPNQNPTLPAVGETIVLDGTFTIGDFGNAATIPARLRVTVTERSFLQDISRLQATLRLRGATDTLVVDMTAEHETTASYVAGAARYSSTTNYAGLLVNPRAEIGARVREEYVIAGVLSPD